MNCFPNSKSNTIVLAPMEGVTDAPMRSLLTSIGGFDYCVSEFIRVSQDVPKLGAYGKLVPEILTQSKTPSQVPVQVQLLGGDPERLAIAALRATEAGACAIDINFGCPAPTVNSHDGGASILKNPCRVYDIVKAVRSLVPEHINVSAKLRLGWDSNETIFETAKYAEEAGANWITIHARTRIQGYKPPAHWPYLRKVREMIKIPVVANGEIWTLEDYKMCKSETGCQHYMLGRGVFADPLLGHKIKAFEHGNKVTKQQKWNEWFAAFTILCNEYSHNPNYALARLKQWVTMASKGGQLLWATNLRNINNLEEFLDLLNRGIIASEIAS